MTLEQRVAVLEEIFLKLRDYYMSNYSGEEIDALLASAGVPIGITKEYDSVSAMNSDFPGTDVTRGQFVLILPSDTSSEDYGKVYLKGTANWVYVFTLTALTAIKGPQGPAGANGETGATGQPGKNFAVLGYYETLSALNAAVPSPEAGDTYGIGTEPPYAYYMYDPTISNWRYVGNLQGPAGSQGEKGDKGDKGDTGATGPQGPEGPVGGASNFVRYDAAQTLTDAQKTQARGNIGAAPDGYGLGAAAVTLTASDDLDNVSGNGWYYWGSSIPANTPTLINAESSPAWCSMLVIDSTQIVCSSNDRNNVAMRTKNNAGWTPWEYVNPALKLGVEYRTTERYLGKPVYCKLVDFGMLAETEKNVSISTPSIDVCVSIKGIAIGTTGNYIGQSIPLPLVRENSIKIYFGGWANGSAVILLTNSTWADVTNFNALAILRYTKSTD